MSREEWLKQVIQTGLQLRDHQSHDSSRFVTIRHDGPRSPLQADLLIPAAGEGCRDAAARFPNIFLHRDIIEMLTTYKH
jgi:hypothetical protein